MRTERVRPARCVCVPDPEVTGKTMMAERHVSHTHEQCVM